MAYLLEDSGLFEGFVGPGGDVHRVLAGAKCKQQVRVDEADCVLSASRHNALCNRAALALQRILVLFVESLVQT